MDPNSSTKGHSQAPHPQISQAKTAKSSCSPGGGGGHSYLHGLHLLLNCALPPHRHPLLLAAAASWPWSLHASAVCRWGGILRAGPCTAASPGLHRQTICHQTFTQVEGARPCTHVRHAVPATTGSQDLAPLLTRPTAQHGWVHLLHRSHNNHCFTSLLHEHSRRCQHAVLMQVAVRVDAHPSISLRATRL